MKAYEKCGCCGCFRHPRQPVAAPAPLLLYHLLLYQLAAAAAKVVYEASGVSCEVFAARCQRLLHAAVVSVALHLLPAVLHVAVACCCDALADGPVAAAALGGLGSAHCAFSVPACHLAQGRRECTAGTRTASHQMRANDRHHAYCMPCSLVIYRNRMREAVLCLHPKELQQTPNAA